MGCTCSGLNSVEWGFDAYLLQTFTILLIFTVRKTQNSVDNYLSPCSRLMRTDPLSDEVQEPDMGVVPDNGPDEWS